MYALSRERQGGQEAGAPGLPARATRARDSRVTTLDQDTRTTLGTGHSG